MVFEWLAGAALGLLSLACGGGHLADFSGDRTAGTSAREADESPPKTGTIATEPTTDTEWLAILIDGQKAGYVKSTRTFFADRVTTEVTTSMEMRRGGETTQIVTVSTLTETLGGAPLKFVKRTNGAGMDQIVSGTIDPDGRLRLTTESAGHLSSRVVDWVPSALMNEGQRIEAKRYGLKEGLTYTSKYFDPDLLEALDVEVHVGGRERLDLLGRITTGTKVTLRMSIRGIPVELVMFVDDEMNTLLTESFRMGMTIKMVACTAPYALSDNDPQEVIRATFIDAPRRLSKSDREAALTYTVSRVIPNEPLHIVSTDEQTVIPRDDDLMVTVTKHPPPLGVAMPYRGDDAAALRALMPNPWIQSDAEEIKKLAKTAVAGALDAEVAARNIERFVADYIEEKTLSVGYASALEVVQSRQGDCTEHALLTAALCRASGIPAQIVFGLVYVERFEEQKDLFGGHAWTRAYLKGKWLSLDAALGGFDTGHLALAVSDGDPVDFFKIVDLIGNLDITSIN